MSYHEGNTPFHLAIMNHKWKIVNLLLLDSIVDKNVINCKGLTPLDVASSIDITKFHMKRAVIMSKLKSVGTKFGPLRKDIVMSENQGSPEEELDRHRAMINNLSIVAALIAAVTFAAAFTLPGGYNNDGSKQEQGMTILAKNFGFQVFLISDTIAMTSSLFVTVLLIYTSSPERDLRLRVIVTAMRFLKVAIGAMLIAFSKGISVVLVPQSSMVFIFILVMTCVSYPYIYMDIWLNIVSLVKSSKIT